MIPDFRKEGWKQVSKDKAHAYQRSHIGEEGYEVWVMEPREDDINFYDTTPDNPVRNSYWIKPKQ